MTTMTTRRRTRWGALGIVAVLAVVLALSLGGPPAAEAPITEPATLEHVDGSELSRITLTDQAAARIDLQTAPVVTAGDRLAVPSAAVIVDPDGSTWVYEAIEPLVFVRAQVVVEDEQDGTAFLADGPAVGTEVVSLGAAELYGVEHGIGH